MSFLYLWNTYTLLFLAVCRVGFVEEFGVSAHPLEHADPLLLRQKTKSEGRIFGGVAQKRSLNFSTTHFFGIKFCTAPRKSYTAANCNAEFCLLHDFNIYRKCTYTLAYFDTGTLLTVVQCGTAFDIYFFISMSVRLFYFILRFGYVDLKKSK